MAIATGHSLASPQDDLTELDALAQAKHAAYIKLRNVILNYGFPAEDLRKSLVQLDSEERTFQAEYSTERAKVQAAIAPQPAPQIVIAHDSAREEAETLRVAEAGRKADALREATALREAEAQRSSNVVGTRPDTQLQAAMARSKEWETQSAIRDAQQSADQAKRIAEQARNEAQMEASRAEEAARNAANAAARSRP